MLSLDRSRRYFVYLGVTDFRKGINGLSGLVRNELDQEPLSRDLFIFFNRHRNRVKILCWDETGYALYYKCLERGTFELPEAKQGESAELSASDLMLILEGIELKSVKRRRRFLLKK